MRPLLRTLALAGALAVCAAPAASAQSSASGEKIAYRVFVDYTKDGEIDPCAFTVEELELALENISPDVRQYASDFPRAIREALSARARGACDPETTGGGAGTPVPSAGGSTGGGVTPTPAAATPVPAGVKTRKVVPEPPAPSATTTPQAAPADPVLERAATSSPGNDAPAPLLGLGILAALLLLSAAALTALKRFGEFEGPLAPAYHSWREAQWRAGGVWDDFRDWLRSGR